MKPQAPGNPAARWRLETLPGSPTAAGAIIAHNPQIARKPGRHNPNVPDIIPELVPRITDRGAFPFVVAAAGFIGHPPAPVALDVRGKIGQTVYQLTFPLNPDGTQSTVKHMQRRRMVVPADPRNTAQLQLRARFGRAVQAWKALPIDTRQAYNARGAAMPRPVEGLNLWIREYARAHAPGDFAQDAEYLGTHGRLPPAP